MEKISLKDHITILHAKYNERQRGVHHLGSLSREEAFRRADLDRSMFIMFMAEEDSSKMPPTPLKMPGNAEWTRAGLKIPFKAAIANFETLGLGLKGDLLKERGDGSLISAVWEFFARWISPTPDDPQSGRDLLKDDWLIIERRPWAAAHNAGSTMFKGKNRAALNLIDMLTVEMVNYCGTPIAACTFGAPVSLMFLPLYIVSHNC